MPIDPVPDVIALPDAESLLLERGEAIHRVARPRLAASGAWQDYLNKVLPPVEGAVAK